MLPRQAVPPRRSCFAWSSSVGSSLWPIGADSESSIPSLLRTRAGPWRKLLARFRLLCWCTLRWPLVSARCWIEWASDEPCCLAELLSAVASRQSAWFGEIWQLYALFALPIVLGSTCTGYLAILKLLSLRGPSRLGSSIGLFHVGQGTGALVASPVLQLIVDGLGWRTGFATLGVFSLLTICGLVLCATTGPEHSGCSRA